MNFFQKAVIFIISAALFFDVLFMFVLLGAPCGISSGDFLAPFSIGLILAALIAFLLHYWKTDRSDT